MEPEVHEVPRLFRSVLRDCVDEANGNDEVPTQEVVFEKQQRSKSLSFVTFRTKLRTNFPKGSNLRGSRGNLQQQVEWSDEEEDGEGEEEEAIKVRARKGRSKSMPEITPIEQSAHG